MNALLPSGATTMDVSPPQIDQLVTPLEELARVGAALSYEKDINRLLEIIIDAAKQFTHADGGTLYRRATYRH
jgi:hypothetical protein